MEIILETEGLILKAELNNSSGAGALAGKLPITVRLSRWGDEYYGDCGLNVEEEDTARDTLEVGEMALWPPGNALCLFFGPTPASTDERPRAASPVVPIGRILDDPSPLKGLGGSIELTLRKV